MYKFPELSFLFDDEFLPEKKLCYIFPILLSSILFDYATAVVDSDYENICRNRDEEEKFIKRGGEGEEICV